MGAPQHPTLTLIDRARGDATPTCARDADAWRLERRARGLVPLPATRRALPR